MSRLTIRIFIINLLLSMAGVFLLQYLFSFSFDFASGVILSFLGCFIVLWLFSYGYSRTYFYRVLSVYSLVLFFIKEFIDANLKLTYEIISIKYHLEPAVVAIPLDITSDLGIMLLANLITLTPGTLSLEVSDDKKYLYVHTIYLEGSMQHFKSKIKNGFEKKVMAVTQ